MDAQCAWKNFGGFTLDEAHKKFEESPIRYQEDFMFMGGKAFAYYFPVIEKFLQGKSDDSQAWILAKGISIQFSGKNIPLVEHLAPRISNWPALYGQILLSTMLVRKSSYELIPHGRNSRNTFKKP